MEIFTVQIRMVILLCTCFADVKLTEKALGRYMLGCTLNVCSAVLQANRVRVQAPTSIFLFATAPRPALGRARAPPHGVFAGERFAWR